MLFHLSAAGEWELEPCKGLASAETGRLRLSYQQVSFLCCCFLCTERSLSLLRRRLAPSFALEDASNSLRYHVKLHLRVHLGSVRPSLYLTHSLNRLTPCSAQNQPVPARSTLVSRILLHSAPNHAHHTRHPFK